MIIRLIVKLLRVRGLPVAQVTVLAILVVGGLIITAAGRFDSAHGASPAPFDSGTAGGNGLVGDANCNGGVDSLDALFILQFSAGLLPSLGCPQNADANGDGEVSSLDAALVLQYAAGLLPAPQPSWSCQDGANAIELMWVVYPGVQGEDAHARSKIVADFEEQCHEWIKATGWNLVNPECHPVPAAGCDWRWWLN